MTKEEAIENLKLVRLNAAMTGAASFKKAIDLAIVALSKPSLPSDLDEAAEKKARDIFESLEKHDIGEEKNRVLFGLLELEALALTFSHFGAEWMARQGFISEGIINQTSGEDTIIELNEHIGYLEDCEEVIANIRKKQ